jgi:hypothetical protein
MGLSGGDNVEGGKATEGSGGAESGGRMEGLLGSREGGIASGGSRGTEAVARNGALGPQTHHPCTCQYLTDYLWFVYLVKGEKEGNRGGAIHISVHLVILFFIHCRLFLEVNISVMLLVHDCWGCLSDGDAEEWKMADVV